MGIVNLASGGLDSTLIGVMSKEEGLSVYPLFIDYGQRAADREWKTCLSVHKRLQLPKPAKMDLSGFGKTITSGLTSKKLDVTKDAFTPGRNLLFLLMASSYAVQKGVSTISIGLLTEKTSLFPDQTESFLSSAEKTISVAMGKKLKIVAPLSSFTKSDVVAMANQRKITGTYSCHLGAARPCGKCISCREFKNTN